MISGFVFDQKQGEMEIHKTWECHQYATISYQLKNMNFTT